STIAGVITESGVVMGTPRYMSPEQARGMKVDGRTDIFSLGVALYEMIAGRAPFEGATPGDVIVSILEREPPPVSRYAEGIPTELERIVAKALRKNRDKRYQNIKDLLLDLKNLKQRLTFEAQLERSAPPIEPAATEEFRVTPSGGSSAEANALSLEGDTPGLPLKAHLL